MVPAYADKHADGYSRADLYWDSDADSDADHHPDADGHTHPNAHRHCYADAHRSYFDEHPDADRHAYEYTYDDPEAHANCANRYTHGDIAAAHGDLHPDPGVSDRPWLDTRSLAWKQFLC